MRKLRVLALVMVFMVSFSGIVMANNGRGNGNIKVKEVVMANEDIKVTGQPAFEANIDIEPDRPEIYVDEIVTLTAYWKTNRDVTHAEWYVDDNNQGVIRIAGSEGDLSFDFSSAREGKYEIKFRIWHHNQNQSDRDAFESVIVTVVAPVDEEVTVVDFNIRKWLFVKQGNTHENNPEHDNKYKLIVTELYVEYSDGYEEIVKLVGNDVLVVGGFQLNELDRSFDIEYGGFKKQFMMDGPTE